MLLSIWEMRMTISADKSGWILKRGCRKIIKLGDGAIPSLHLKENGSDSTLFCGLLPFLSIL